MGLFDSAQAQKYLGAKSAAAGDHATGAAGAAVNVVFGAVTLKANCIGGLYWSLTADPAGPVTVQVKDGSTVLHEFDITNKGPGFIPFRLKGSVGATLTLAMSAPGGAVVGKIGACSHWTE